MLGPPFQPSPMGAEEPSATPQGAASRALPSLGLHRPSAGGAWALPLGWGPAWTKKGGWLMMEALPCRNSSVAQASCPWSQAGSFLGRPSRLLRSGGRMACLRANLGLRVGSLVPTRTQYFHHFLKLALTKNPKKRPTAEKLLQVGGRGVGQGARCSEAGTRRPGTNLHLLHPPAPLHDPAVASGSPHTAVGQGQ